MGCGEGELTSCLCNPAPWLAIPVPLPSGHDTAQADDTHTTESPDHTDAIAQVKNIQDDYMHLRSIHALDTCSLAIELAQKACSPPPSSKDGFWGDYVRWEDLDVKIWKGGLEAYNPEFVGVDCIICTEVYVILLARCA